MGFQAAVPVTPEITVVKVVTTAAAAAAEAALVGGTVEVDPLGATPAPPGATPVPLGATLATPPLVVRLVTLGGDLRLSKMNEIPFFYYCTLD